MRIVAMTFVVAVLAGAASAQEVAYVKSEVANQRSGPGAKYPIQNKVYIGQKVTIYDRKNGWARVTGLQYDPRWISESLLSPERPDVAKGFVLPAELRRADLAGLEAEPLSNLDASDVIALRRFGAHILDTGQCKKIEYGDESVNKPGELYVICSDNSKKTAPKSKWIK